MEEYATLASPSEMAEARGALVDNMGAELDASIAALRDRLELLAARVSPVMRMSLPQPENPSTKYDTPVGDHSSPLAQKQFSRALQVASATTLVNDMLERLEL